MGATAQHMATMGILFEQHARINDMKGVSRTKAPPLEKIEAYLLVYNHGQFPLASKRVINRIAWANVRDSDQVKFKS